MRTLEIKQVAKICIIGFLISLMLVLLASCKSNVVEPVQPDFSLNGVWQSYKDNSLENHTYWHMMAQIESRKGQGQFSDQLYQFSISNVYYSDNESQNVSFDMTFNFYGVGEIMGQFFGNVKIVNDKQEVHGHVAIPALNVYGVVHLKRQGIQYLPKKGHDQGGINSGY
jgi:hypothetical protein